MSYKGKGKPLQQEGIEHTEVELDEQKDETQRKTKRVTFVKGTKEKDGLGRLRSRSSQDKKNKGKEREEDTAPRGGDDETNRIVLEKVKNVIKKRKHKKVIVWIGQDFFKNPDSDRDLENTPVDEPSVKKIRDKIKHEWEDEDEDEIGWSEEVRFLTMLFSTCFPNGILKEIRTRNIYGLEELMGFSWEGSSKDVMLYEERGSINRAYCNSCKGVYNFLVEGFLSGNPLSPPHACPNCDKTVSENTTLYYDSGKTCNDPDRDTDCVILIGFSENDGSKFVEQYTSALPIVFSNEGLFLQLRPVDKK